MAKCVFAFLLIHLLGCPLFLSAQLPPGYIGLYPLNNSATDISGNNYNGSLTATTATTNRFSVSNMATLFSSGTSYGNLPTLVQDNFSIGFWFKTTMNANSAAMWYSGNSLINAEVCGVTNDWGTALINGGKVCMGIGNPDITISTTSNYNDGNWHFVTAVRDKTNGIITLYVDGLQAATTSGTNTGSLNAPGAIGLARDATFYTSGCGSGTSPDYTGSLDDIIVYNRVLSSTEVAGLYSYLSGTPLPLDWLSFTGINSGNGIDLYWSVEDVVNNAYFEVEHSTDGQNFSSIARILNDGVEMTPNGSGSYSFLDAHAAPGVNYYRIRQVDIDGDFSWSKTIAIVTRNSWQAFSLFPNPSRVNPILSNAGSLFVREVRVVDVSGKILLDQPVNTNSSSITLDTHTLSPGYFWIQVEGVSGQVVVVPFVKI
ncbi:MAG: LamG domain-containing protein [Puia sp.]|nr:LamG domain-containing protein [Puia sp.]